MKFQVFFFTFAAVLLAGVRSREWSEHDEECMKELNLNRAEMEPFKDADFVPEDNEDLNTLQACSWKKDGTMNEKGEIVWSKVEEVFADEMEEELKKSPNAETLVMATVIAHSLEECKGKLVQSENHGEMIAKLENCVMHELQSARR